MKQTITILITLLCLVSPGLFADDPLLEPPFVPMSPEVLAQGGSFVANAAGYNALFFNPAGFSVGEKTVTVLSATSWVYADPRRFVQSLDGRPSLAEFVDGEVTDGGFGFGGAVGIGYVGHGLGLAAVLSLDSYLYGATAAEAEGHVNVTLGFVAGFSLPLQLAGVKLHLGADLRPMIRISAPVDYATMVDVLRAFQSGGDPLAPLADAPALYGRGFGIDVGTIVELGDLRFGVAARDLLGTGFSYRQSTIGEVVDSLSASAGLPAGGVEVGGHLIPMNLAVGLAYDLDLGPVNSFFDPTIHASLDDLVGVMRRERSLWTAFQVGVEARVWRILTLRGGFQQGCWTFGGGMRLLWLDVNAAVLVHELGDRDGAYPGSGLSLEAALRF